MRPASPSRSILLLSRTSPIMRQKVSEFVRTRLMKLSAGQEVFTFSWDTQRNRVTDWPHVVETKVIQVTHARRTCGYAYYSSVPFSPRIAQQVGLITSLEKLRPAFFNPHDSLWPSPQTLRIAEEYYVNFSGLDTALISLCLHLAAKLGYPYLSANVALDRTTPETCMTFYDWHGFRSGIEVNIFMLRQNIKAYVEHSLAEKVFYLNGALDSEMPFIIPEISISAV